MPAWADYPRMMFHRTRPPVTVKSRDEEDALGAEWSRTLFPAEPSMATTGTTYPPVWVVKAKPEPAPEEADADEPPFDPTPAPEKHHDKAKAPKHHAKPAPEHHEKPKAARKK